MHLHLFDLCHFLCITSYYAVLEVGDGVFEVLSTSGDTHLGGDDFDKVWNMLICLFIYFSVHLILYLLTIMIMFLCRELLIGLQKVSKEMKE